MNITTEKNCKLSCQERYEILDFACQAAEDNGFMNSFVFERAIYCFAAIRLLEDRKDEIAAAVAENLLVAWQGLVEDGTIEDMVANYPDELNLLADEGQVWLSEYEEYVHSARGLLDTIQMFAGDIVSQAAQQLQAAQENGEVQQVIEIADKWGMNNKNPLPAESVFKE